MDFQKIIDQFKDTNQIKFISLKREWNRSPDQLFYEIETNQRVLYVYEIDYIGDFNKDVLDVIRDEIPSFTEIFVTKQPLGFDESSLVLFVKQYRKPADWSVISKYANDKYGSKPYYFNFLIK